MNNKIITKIAQQFKNSLNKLSTQERIEYNNKYLKQQVQSRGVKQQDIKSAYIQVWNEHKNKLDLQNKINLAYSLLKSDFFEDKIVGVKILEDIHKQIQNHHIDEVKQIIKEGYLKEWASIDRLSYKFLKSWVEQNKENTEYISQWRFEKDSLWVRRCCCVTFINLARFGDDPKKNFKGFTDIMFDICQEIVEYQERFSQLGCGWLVRNLTVCSRKRGVQFIEDNYNHFTREGLRYAIQKLDDKERLRLLNLNKTKKSQKTKQSMEIESFNSFENSEKEEIKIEEDEKLSNSNDNNNMVTTRSRSKSAQQQNQAPKSKMKLESQNIQQI